MFSEAHLGGILFAPIVVYCAMGAVIFVPVRLCLSRTGVLAHVWHPALLEVALYAIITSAIVLALA